MLKPQQNPPMIWPEHLTVAKFEGTWWVVHTKSRNEKALARHLKNKNIQHFLPMRKKTTRLKGRKYYSMLPLFPSYVFLCLSNHSQRLDVLASGRVVRLLEVQDSGQLICELAAIEKVLQSGRELEPQTKLKVGQRCRILTGPLAGVEGFIRRAGGNISLVLQIEMLGQAVSVTIDRDIIEPVCD